MHFTVVACKGFIKIIGGSGQISFLSWCKYGTVWRVTAGVGGESGMVRQKSTKPPFLGRGGAGGRIPVNDYNTSPNNCVGVIRFFFITKIVHIFFIYSISQQTELMIVNTLSSTLHISGFRLARELRRSGQEGPGRLTG